MKLDLDKVLFEIIKGQDRQLREMRKQTEILTDIDMVVRYANGFKSRNKSLGDDQREDMPLDAQMRDVVGVASDE